MDKIELSKMLGQLRADLLRTQSEGQGSDLKFEIQDVEIELQIVATKGKKGDAGIKFWVFNANAKLEDAEVKTQKLKLTLKPVSAEDGEPFNIGDEDKLDG